MAYGKELILDLHNCDPATFNRASLTTYFIKLCDLIDMERRELHFWEDEQLIEPHTKGISAVQFIVTSNITIHTLELLKTVYVNIFSCKEFDANVAEEFTVSWFGGEIAKSTEIDRD